MPVPRGRRGRRTSHVRPYRRPRPRGLGPDPRASLRTRGRGADVPDRRGPARRARAPGPSLSTGDDPGDLLVHWLNTALLEAEVRGAVWTRAAVRGLTPRSLEGTLEGPRRGAPGQVMLREVKAVSHHGLEVDLGPGACRCRLVL